MVKKKAAGKKSAAKKKAGADRQAMIITTSGDRPIHDVASDLKAAGFEVGQVLDAIGSVTGYADPAVRKQLKSVRGVADVSDDQAVEIGPPGAPVS